MDRMRLQHVATAVGGALCLVACLSPRHGPVVEYRADVTLETAAGSSSAASGSTIAPTGVRPPECPELALPEYPPALVDRGLPVIRVRVDFLLDREGFTESVEARVLEPGEGEHAAFAEAAESTVRIWRCRPAWRHPVAGEPRRWVPLEFRSWAVFRFSVESVQLSARGGGRRTR